MRKVIWISPTTNTELALLDTARYELFMSDNVDSNVDFLTRDQLVELYEAIKRELRISGG